MTGFPSRSVKPWRMRKCTSIITPEDEDPARIAPGRRLVGALAIVALVVAARSVVIVDQTEAVYVTEFGRPVRLIERAGAALEVAAPEPARVRQAAPARRAAAARDADARQEEPGSRLVRELEDRRRRAVPPARSAPCPTPRPGWRTWRRRSWRPSSAGTTWPSLVTVDRDSALDALMADVTDRIGEQAGREYGLKVVDVRLRRLNYPEEVRSAVFEQIRSERKRVAAATRAEGESQARTIRSAADLERARTVAEAEADAARVVGEGEAQATRIANDAHAADPAFYQFLKTLETYRSRARRRRRRSSCRPTARSCKLLTQGVPSRRRRRHVAATARDAPPTTPAAPPAVADRRSPAMRRWLGLRPSSSGWSPTWPPAWRWCSRTRWASSAASARSSPSRGRPACTGACPGASTASTGSSPARRGP